MRVDLVVLFGDHLPRLVAGRPGPGVVIDREAGAEILEIEALHRTLDPGHAGIQPGIVVELDRIGGQGPSPFMPGEPRDIEVLARCERIKRQEPSEDTSAAWCGLGALKAFKPPATRQSLEGKDCV